MNSKGSSTAYQLADAFESQFSVGTTYPDRGKGEI
jgi:hypothetical protein